MQLKAKQISNPPVEYKLHNDTIVESEKTSLLKEYSDTCKRSQLRRRALVMFMQEDVIDICLLLCNNLSIIH